MNKNILVAYKVLFAFLALFALGQEITALIMRDAFDLVTFYSFFTNQSNTFAAAMLLISAWFVLHNKTSGAVTLLRGGASLYLILTGVVFNFLLSGDGTQWTEVPIDNTILHVIMPLALAIDWLLDPPKKRIPFTRALLWLVYPIIYAVCAIIRGAMTGFYPYSFFDPVNGGYQTVAFYVVGIALFVAVAAWLLSRIPLRIKGGKARSR